MTYINIVDYCVYLLQYLPPLLFVNHSGNLSDPIYDSCNNAMT